MYILDYLTSKTRHIDSPVIESPTYPQQVGANDTYQHGRYALGWKLYPVWAKNTPLLPGENILFWKRHNEYIETHICTNLSHSLCRNQNVISMQFV